MEDPQLILQTASAIRDLGTRQHGSDVFYTEFLEDYLRDVGIFASQLWLVFGSLAGVALLAGNLSVMAFMLVSVRSRTREISIRMAVGARRRDVLRQFLSEAVVLSVVGGLLGTLVAWGIILIARYFDLPAASTLWIFLLPPAIAVAMAIPFAAIPGCRAAAIDPVASLSES